MRGSVRASRAAGRAEKPQSARRQHEHTPTAGLLAARVCLCVCACQAVALACWDCEGAPPPPPNGPSPAPKGPTAQVGRGAGTRPIASQFVATTDLCRVQPRNCINNNKNKTTPWAWDSSALSPGVPPPPCRPCPTAVAESPGARSGCCERAAWGAGERAGRTCICIHQHDQLRARGRLGERGSVRGRRAGARYVRGSSATAQHATARASVAVYVYGCEFYTRHAPARRPCAAVRRARLQRGGW
jgi:hypothetical protein